MIDNQRNQSMYMPTANVSNLLKQYCIGKDNARSARGVTRAAKLGDALADPISRGCSYLVRHHGDEFGRIALVPAVNHQRWAYYWKTEQERNKEKESQSAKLAEENQLVQSEATDNDDDVSVLINRVIEKISDSIWLKLEKKIEGLVKQTRAPNEKIMAAAGGVDLTKLSTEQIPNKIRPDKKRILVVGAMPNQKNILQLAAPDCVEIHATQTTNVSGGWDEILLWTDFISHKHSDAVKKTNCKWRYISGGLTAISKYLKDECVGQSKKEQQS